MNLLNRIYMQDAKNRALVLIANVETDETEENEFDGIILPQSGTGIRSINWNASILWNNEYSGALLSVVKNLRNQGWTFVVTEQKRGYCKIGRKQVALPAWIFSQDRTETYRDWYIAHECAHAIDECKHNHGVEFMLILKEICPKESQKFEYTYKPQAARQARLHGPSSLSLNK